MELEDSDHTNNVLFRFPSYDDDDDDDNNNFHYLDCYYDDEMHSDVSVEGIIDAVMMGPDEGGQGDMMPPPSCSAITLTPCDDGSFGVSSLHLLPSEACVPESMEGQRKCKGIKHDLIPELQERKREKRRRDANARKRAYRSRRRWIKEHEPLVAQLVSLAQTLWGCGPAPQESSVVQHRWMNKEAYVKERIQEFKEWAARPITFVDRIPLLSLRCKQRFMDEACASLLEVQTCFTEIGFHFQGEATLWKRFALLKEGQGSRQHPEENDLEWLFEVSMQELILVSFVKAAATLGYLIILKRELYPEVMTQSVRALRVLYNLCLMVECWRIPEWMMRSHCMPRSCVSAAALRICFGANAWCYLQEGIRRCFERLMDREELVLDEQRKLMASFSRDPCFYVF